MGLELKLPSLVGTPDIRFLAVVEDAATRDTASRTVTELGWHQAKIVEGGLDKAAAAIDPAAPANLLLIDIGGSTDPFAGLDKLAEHCPPETKVLAVGTANDVALYRRLLSLGIGDYLLKPVTAPMLRDALLHVARPSLSKELVPAAPPKSARLLALIGARGGVGTSMLATAIGWCLAEERARKVALLDLDLQFGNLALGLDLESGRGLRDALEHPERIDSLLLAGAMSGTSEQLRILGAEEPLDDQPHLDPSSVDPLVGALTDGFDFIVADLPRTLDGMTRRLIARADKVAIVSDFSLTAMRDTQRLAALIEILQPGVKPLVIINRAGMLPRGEVPQAEFEKGSGRKIDAVVPYDAKAAGAMAEQAKPLPAVAKSSKAAAEIRRIATLFTGAEAEKPRSLLKRLLG